MVVDYEKPVTPKISYIVFFCVYHRDTPHRMAEVGAGSFNKKTVEEIAELGMMSMSMFHFGA